jgi:hypothetical protein
VAQTRFLPVEICDWSVKKNHTPSLVYLIRDIQGDSRRKGHTLGSDFICYYRKKIV